MRAYCIEACRHVHLECTALSGLALLSVQSSGACATVSGRSLGLGTKVCTHHACSCRDMARVHNYISPTYRCKHYINTHSPCHAAGSGLGRLTL